MDKPKVTRALQRLEARGLVQRAIVSADRRQVRLTLTRRGRLQFRQIAALALEWEAEPVAQPVVGRAHCVRPRVDQADAAGRSYAGQCDGRCRERVTMLKLYSLFPLVGRLPVPHRPEPEGARARDGVRAPHQGRRPAHEAGVSRGQPASAAADAGARRPRYHAVAGDHGVSGRDPSQAGAAAGRCGAARQDSSVCAGDRVRYPPAEQSARAQLPQGSAGRRIRRRWIRGIAIGWKQGWQHAKRCCRRARPGSASATSRRSPMRASCRRSITRAASRPI